MTRRCSEEISIKCHCYPDAPRVGTPLYAEKRTHPDAGDLEALRVVTGWIKGGEPCMHLRYADGEFYSIRGQQGVNSDGLAFQPETLGVELHKILIQISNGAARNLPLLVGGDWTIPDHAAYVWEFGLERTVPWCPSGIWVNGIVSGALAEFFVALLRDPRPKILVGNDSIKGAAGFLGANFISVPASAAWAARGDVGYALRQAPKHAIVMYCAGMASEVFAWTAWNHRPDLTHLDMGHVFDGAFGVRSRSWLSTDGQCKRRDTYFEKYAPVMRGEKSSFGEF